MSDVAFDVLEALDGLKSAGFTEGQARALADSLQSIAGARSADLVTKSDLRAEVALLRSELKDDMSTLRSELKDDMSALRSELLKAMADQQRWTIGAMVLLPGILFTAIKLT